LFDDAVGVVPVGEVADDESRSRSGEIGYVGSALVVAGVGNYGMALFDQRSGGTQPESRGGPGYKNGGHGSVYPTELPS